MMSQICEWGEGNAVYVNGAYSSKFLGIIKNHLSVFRKASVQTLSDIVGPWHHVEGFQSEFGVVARGAWDAGYRLLQQLIHFEGEILAER